MSRGARVHRVYMHVRRYGSRECEGGIRYTCACEKSWGGLEGQLRGSIKSWMECEGGKGHVRSDGGLGEGCQM